jgi:hypothetical protein
MHMNSLTTLNNSTAQRAFFTYSGQGDESSESEEDLHVCCCDYKK